MTDCPLWPIWLHTMAWLNQNSSAVTAVATLAGVVVAAAYSVFAALQWRATKAQADITRRIFEASHRPYVMTEVREPPIPARTGACRSPSPSRTLALFPRTLRHGRFMAP